MAKPKPMKLGDKLPSEMNPRRISPEKSDQLGKTMSRYGDLSGITWNRRLKRLATGHQRREKLGPDCEIVIEKIYDQSTEQGTTAEGFVVGPDGSRWRYRETDWSEEDHLAAMIAANASGGKFEFAKLAEIVVHLDELDFPMEALGLTESEIENIVAPVPLSDGADSQIDANEHWINGNLPEFEGGAKMPFRVIVIITDESKRETFVKLLKVSETLKRRENVWSCQWPE